MVQFDTARKLTSIESSGKLFLKIKLLKILMGLNSAHLILTRVFFYHLISSIPLISSILNLEKKLL